MNKLAMDIRFHAFGTDPIQEAVRMKQMCDGDGIDQKIIEEFEGTIEAYRTLELQNAAQRISEKYGVGKNSPLAGDIVSIGTADVAVSYCGLKNFLQPNRNTCSGEIIPGVNVSYWVLLQHRGRKLGSLCAQYTTARAESRTQDPTDTMWYGRQIWTSIHEENTPSRKAIESAGYEPTFHDIEKPERIIYLLQRTL